MGATSVPPIPCIRISPTICNPSDAATNEDMTVTEEPVSHIALTGMAAVILPSSIVQMWQSISISLIGLPMDSADNDRLVQCHSPKDAWLDCSEFFVDIDFFSVNVSNASFS